MLYEHEWQRVRGKVWERDTVLLREQDKVCPRGLPSQKEPDMVSVPEREQPLADPLARELAFRMALAPVCQRARSSPRAPDTVLGLEQLLAQEQDDPQALEPHDPLVQALARVLSREPGLDVALAEALPLEKCVELAVAPVLEPQLLKEVENKALIFNILYL